MAISSPLSRSTEMAFDPCPPDLEVTVNTDVAGVGMGLLMAMATDLVTDDDGNVWMNSAEVNSVDNPDVRRMRYRFWKTEPDPAHDAVKVNDPLGTQMEAIESSE